MPGKCFYIDLGFCDYWETLALQGRLVEAVRKGVAGGHLFLLVEHNPVVTVGRRPGAIENLKVNLEFLRKKGIALVKVGRGGDLTYHGPGQLVGYPIIDLRALYRGDVIRYLRDLEEVLILTLHDLGFAAYRREGYTGVWVGREKVAAIGIQVTGGIAWHGFALNVNPDLAHFQYIYPCGIREYGVTSLQRLSGREIPLGKVKLFLRRAFGKVMGLKLMALPPENKERLMSCPASLTG